jgi:hypothetical protein
MTRTVPPFGVVGSCPAPILDRHTEQDVLSARGRPDRYRRAVNFAVCPDDGTRLDAWRRPDPGQPLLLTCPACSKHFQLTESGIIEVPAGPGEQGT